MDDRSSSSSADESATLHVSAPPSPGRVRVGEKLARYVVLEDVGHGGMGRVYRAYDPKLQREVALKELRTKGSDATQRLVAEARAMAKLSHPNVVSVYDVEELDDGGVVLVMEYVAGETLKAWLQAERHSWQTILERFVAAGEGLLAAHRAGVLHRDFKPANVMVATDLVKVTDFGIAKAGASGPSLDSVDGELDLQADDMTDDGTVKGTPRYMAPEQHRKEPLSAAADQYAFCVALWEALCGRPPFAGTSIAEDKAAGPPSFPSSGVPASIAEAITRGLSPDPASRWPTMAELLAAIREDISADARRWALGAAAVGGLVLIGGAYVASTNGATKPCSGAADALAGSWDDARRTEIRDAFSSVERAYADEAWTRTQRALDDYADAWKAAHTEACEATTVRGEQSPAMMDLRMACLNRASVGLQATVDVLASADAGVVRKAEALTNSLPSLDRCADLEALGAAFPPPVGDDARPVEEARAALARAYSLDKSGRAEEAREAVEDARRLLEGVEYGPVQAELALMEGYVLGSLAEFDAARDALKEAIRLGSHWRLWDEVQRAHVQMMYIVGVRQGHTAEAQQYAYVAEGLAHGDPRALSKLKSARANLLHFEGKYSEAEREHREAIELWAAQPEADPLELAVKRDNLAVALATQGRLKEAEAEFRSVVELREKTLGRSHPSVALGLGNLANTLIGQGRDADAEKLLRESIALQTAAFSPDHPDLALARANLGSTLNQRERYAEAAAELRAAVTTMDKVLGTEHPQAIAIRSNLGNALAGQGKYAEAEVEFRTAITRLESSGGPDHPTLAAMRANFAKHLLDQERFDEALVQAELAWTVQNRDDRDPYRRAANAFILAQILRALGEQARALEFAKQARGLYEDMGESKAERLAEIDAWVAEGE